MYNTEKKVVVFETVSIGILSDVWTGFATTTVAPPM